ncbi:MAG: hypothetical protein JWQ98_1925 [Chlorobi bacterium]|nr:hypothetical protein [Chlorobiota bacterium]
MRHPRIALSAFIWIIVTAAASGQKKEMVVERARNIIYGESASGLIVAAGSINYERCLTDHISLRAGAGLGHMFSNGFHGSGGGLFMLNCFSDGKYPGIEFGAELSYSLPKNDMIITSMNPTPAISFGMRFQTEGEGLFGRIGLTYDFRFGFPLQLSIGKSF